MRTLMLTALLAIAAFGYPVQQGGGFGQRGGTAGGGRGNPVPVPGGVGIIEGFVQRSDTQQPLDQVTVLLTMPDATGGGRASSSTITDGSGHFIFRNVALSDYTIVARRDGYFGRGLINPSTPIDTSTMNSTSVGTLTVSKPSVQLTLFLSPTITISGHVTDADGRPAANVQIDALQKDFSIGDPRLVSKKNVMTDDRGQYRLFGLQSGEYFVRALVNPVTAAAALPSSSATTYFNQAADTRDAVSLTLGSGSDQVADIQLIRSSAVSISGRAVLPDPAAIGASSFWLIPKGLDFTDDAETQVASVNPNNGSGVFRVRANRPGIYDLFYRFRVRPTGPARPGEATNAPIFYGRTTVDVGTNDIEGVTIVANPTVELSVQFNTNGDSALIAPPVPNLFRLIPWSPALPQAFRASIPSIVRTAAGQVPSTAVQPIKFESVVEGDYRLGVLPTGLTTDGYIAEMRQGTKDILEDGIIHIEGEKPDPVEIVLKRGGATVEGAVQDSLGKPAAGAFVVLIPDGSRRQNPLLYRHFQVDVGGVFTLRGISPGNYILFAWNQDPAGNELTPEFIAKYEQLGRTLAISAGSSTKDVVVRLILQAPK